MKKLLIIALFIAGLGSSGCVVAPYRERAYYPVVYPVIAVEAYYPIFYQRSYGYPSYGHHNRHYSAPSRPQPHGRK